MRERCEDADDYLAFIADPSNSPRGDGRGRPASTPTSCAPPPGSTPPAGNAAIYYGLGVTEHSPGLDDGDGHGQPGHGHRQHRPRGRRRQPAARAEQRAGLLRHGLVPARVPRLPARLRRRRARHLRAAVGARPSTPSRACGSPTCSTPRSPARSAGSTSRARTSPSPTPTPSTSRRRCGRWTCVVVQDLFLNETAQVRPRLPARHVVPGEGRHLHQRRAPDQPGPPGDRLQGRQGRVGGRLRRSRRAMGYDMSLRRTPREIMDEIAATTPTFAGVSFARLDEVGSMQWPVQRHRLDRHADHAHRRVRARQGPASSRPSFVPTDRAVAPGSSR